MPVRWGVKVRVKGRAQNQSSEPHKKVVQLPKKHATQGNSKNEIVVQKTNLLQVAQRRNAVQIGETGPGEPQHLEVD